MNIGLCGTVPLAVVLLDERPEGVSVACCLLSTECLKRFVAVEVSKGVTLEIRGEALGVGVSVEDGFVM